MTELIAVRRHEYLLAPGEGVITTPHLSDLAERAASFQSDTQLESDEIITTPVVQMPLPVTLFQAGERVRSQAAPEMMWFPLFWLPSSVGLRRTFPAADGEAEREESDAEWAIRVMSMSGAAGLFDAESGTWLDVLSMVGLDSDDDETVARVRAWQQGGDDDILDSINLEPLFTASDSEQVADAALESTPDVIAAQYAISASDIGESITAVLDAPALDAEDQKGAAYYYLVLAHTALHDDPDVDSIPKAQTQVAELLRRLRSQDEAGGEVEVVAILKDLRSLCGRVYLTFEPFLAVIGALASETEDDPATEGDAETSAPQQQPEPQPAPTIAGWG